MINMTAKEGKQAIQDIMKQGEMASAVKAINEVIDRLDSWADTAGILYRENGDEAQKNQYINYTNQAIKLRQALKVIHHS